MGGVGILCRQPLARRLGVDHRPAAREQPLLPASGCRGIRRGFVSHEHDWRGMAIAARQTQWAALDRGGVGCRAFAGLRRQRPRLLAWDRAAGCGGAAHLSRDHAAGLVPGLPFERDNVSELAARSLTRAPGVEPVGARAKGRIVLPGWECHPAELLVGWCQPELPTREARRRGNARGAIDV